VPSFFSWKFWYASGAASSAHRIDPHVPFAVPHNRFHCFPFRPGAVILALFVGYPGVDAAADHDVVDAASELQ